MEDIEFTCDRAFIDKFPSSGEKAFISSLYCANYFEFVDFAKLFYKTFRGNAVLTLLAVLALIPLINISLRHIASRFLAPTISGFRRSLKWNPITTSFTLMALTNGLPSVIIQMAGPATATVHESVGAVYGSFIFNVTVVCAVVIISNPRELKMPRYAVMRELLVFLASVLVVVVFGFVGSIDYGFVALYFLMYVGYLLLSIRTEEVDKIEDNLDDFDFAAGDASAGPSGKDLLKSRAPSNQRGSQRFSKVGQPALKASQLGASGLDFEVNFDVKTDEDARQEDRELEAAFFTRKNLSKVLWTDVVSLTDGHLTSLIQSQVNLVCLFVFPSSRNPLMKSPLRPLLLGLSLALTLFALQVFRFQWALFGVLFLGFSALAFALGRLRVDEARLALAYDFVALLSGVALTKLYVSLFSDAIKFYKFYYSVNDLIVSAIFLSAADSLGKFYINIALAAQGELILAILSTYSVQTFQNFVGFSLVAFSRVSRGKLEFDLFHMDRGGGMRDVSRGLLFFSSVIGLTVAVIAIILIYYKMNRFLVKRNFPTVLLLIYASFTVYSLFMGRKSANKI